MERDSFTDALEASTQAVHAVARWLRAKGCAVEELPVVIRPTYADRHQYRDQGDLRVNGKRVDVKGRSLDFTSAATYPFPTILVDVCHAFDPQSVAYVIVNRTLTHCAVIRTTTRPHWSTIRLRERHRGERMDPYYVCPVGLARFHPMEV